jgi:NAD(P)-dependent dehydrogenase (short-subunit alcohol dehydrogenase family)
MRFENKVVLITGGSRNTGFEIVTYFLEEGARVYFCGSSEETVSKANSELEKLGFSKYRGLVCNVTSTESVTAMMDVIEKEAGRLDILVSNAASMGLGQGTSLETTDAQFLEVLNTNILGGFRVAQAAANRFFLKQQPNDYTRQRGIIVFVGSNTSDRVSRKRISYLASKGGIDSMVKSLGVDFGPLGIRVNMVAPGYIWSDRWNFLSDEVKAKRRSNIPIGFEATGRDVAEAVAFFASDGARACQGARLVVDGGSSAQLYPASCEDDTSTMRYK